MSVVDMHATAAQLDHAVAQAAQTGQVKFGVAVGAARPLGLDRGQHPVGANHLACGRIAHQQVLAVVIEQVDVMALDGLGQTCTELGGENRIPQALRFTNFVLMVSPADLNGALHAARQEVNLGLI